MNPSSGFCQPLEGFFLIYNSKLWRHIKSRSARNAIIGVEMPLMMRKKHYRLRKKHYRLRKKHYRLQKKHYRLRKKHYRLRKKHYRLRKKYHRLRKKYYRLRKKHYGLRKKYQRLRKKLHGLRKKLHRLYFYRKCFQFFAGFLYYIGQPKKPPRHLLFTGRLFQSPRE